MIQPDKETAQQVADLRKRRDELRTRLAQIDEDYRRGLAADAEEQAIQLENAEVLAGIAKAAAEELEAIEERLAELE